LDIELVSFITKGDRRGSLIALEDGINVPFDIKRCYYIYGTQKGVRRGFHAHKKLQQMVICVAGSCRFFLDDGQTTEEVLLDNPNKGLLLKGLIWREMYDFSDDCVLVVLADQIFDESDYIRNYHDFQQLVLEKTKSNNEE
jgi:dTDP-4-dehydrorhamnose 3,5-epimerase-like enzyme